VSDASADASGTAQSEPAAPAITQEPPSRSEAAVGYSVGPISDVSSGCPETGDIEEATDPVRGYVYVAFEGCDHGNRIGTLYVAFMNTVERREYPTIDVSHDQGQTFTVENSLRPQQVGTWGDAEYLAVAPDEASSFSPMSVVTPSYPDAGADKGVPGQGALKPGLIASRLGTSGQRSCTWCTTTRPTDALASGGHG
jgi:hypothetical protein